MVEEKGSLTRFFSPGAKQGACGGSIESKTTLRCSLPTARGEAQVPCPERCRSLLPAPQRRERERLLRSAGGGAVLQTPRTAHPLGTYQTAGLNQGSFQIRVDVLQVPPEALALELLSQLDLLGQVADIHVFQEQVVSVAVEELLVLVQPDLCHAGQVPLHCSHPVFWEGIRIVIPENVPNSGARNYLDLSSAHPDLRNRGHW